MALINDFLPDEAYDYTSLESAINYFNTCVKDRVVISSTEPSFESFFDRLGYMLPNVLKYGFKFGKLGKIEPKLIVEYLKEKKEEGYSKLRTATWSVAPGFSGNLLDYFKFIEGELRYLMTLNSDLKKFITVFSSIMNGNDLLDSPLGIKELETITTTTTDPKLYQSFYTNKLIDNNYIGKIFRNLSEMESSLDKFNELVELNNKQDYGEMETSLKVIGGYVKDFKKRHNKGDKIMANAASTLMTTATILAIASDNSVRIQMSLKEWEVAIRRNLGE